MHSLRLSLGTVLICGLTLLAFPADSAAQAISNSSGSSASSARSDWSQRVLRSSHSTAQQTVLNEGTFQAALLEPSGGDTTATHVSLALAEEEVMPMGAGPGQPEYIPLGDEYLGGGACTSCGSPGSACDSCGDCCDTCLPGCGAGCGPCAQLWSNCAAGLARKTSYFAGVHGFKGPLDQGANGNFGLHYGLNFATPLGDPWGIGLQAGVQAVHSNFSGDQVAGARTNDRDQVFFTTGLFRRPVCGKLQWGVVLDFLHDSYYDEVDLTQMRAEISLLRRDCSEIGFWGAFGTNDDTVTFVQNAALTTSLVEPLDVFALFYRRHFSGGGQGRVWVGATNESDTLFGGDISVPLGTSWALENNFTYMLPEEGRGANGQQNESWSVMMQLVWYPGRHAACVKQDRFSPLFGVADNTWFLVDRK